MNKDNIMRRTFGDNTLIQSTVTKKERLLKNHIPVPKKRGANVKGIKLVEFSKVDGSKVCHFTYF